MAVWTLSGPWYLQNKNTNKPLINCASTKSYAITMINRQSNEPMKM